MYVTAGGIGDACVSRAGRAGGAPVAPPAPAPAQGVRQKWGCGTPYALPESMPSCRRAGVYGVVLGAGGVSLCGGVPGGGPVAIRQHRTGNGLNRCKPREKTGAGCVFRELGLGAPLGSRLAPNRQAFGPQTTLIDVLGAGQVARTPLSPRDESLHHSCTKATSSNPTQGGASSLSEPRLPSLHLHSIPDS